MRLCNLRTFSLNIQRFNFSIPWMLPAQVNMAKGTNLSFSYDGYLQSTLHNQPSHQPISYLTWKIFRLHIKTSPFHLLLWSSFISNSIPFQPIISFTGVNLWHHKINNVTNKRISLFSYNLGSMQISAE